MDHASRHTHCLPRLQGDALAATTGESGVQAEKPVPLLVVHVAVEQGLVLGSGADEVERLAAFDEDVAHGSRAEILVEARDRALLRDEDVVGLAISPGVVVEVAAHDLVEGDGLDGIWHGELGVRLFARVTVQHVPVLAPLHLLLQIGAVHLLLEVLNYHPYHIYKLLFTISIYLNES